MSSSQPGIRASEALRALRERFRATSASTLDRFRDLIAQLALDPSDSHVLENLRDELHRVHGTAGSYGFAEASTLAARLEERVVRWQRDATDELSQRSMIIGHFVSALTLALATEVTVVPAPARRRLLLLDLAPAFVRALRAEAATRGYQLTVGYLEDLDLQALRGKAPHVIITTVESAVTLRDSVAPMNVPMVAIGDASDSQKHMLQALTDVPVLSPGGSVPVLFDLADRLYLGSSSTGATILVLDDDPSILVITRYLLESEGVHIETTTEPGLLHRRLSATAPSLLLMDVRMGAVSGIDLARDLRSFPAFADLPILLVASELDADQRQAAEDAGVDDVIAKPIVAADLRARIAEHLERHRLHRLAEGRHPGTGLSLPARTAADAAAFLGRAASADRVVAAVVVRPDAAEIASDVAAAWLRETQRIATAVAGTASVVGYHEGVALFIALEADADVAESLFEALASGRVEGTPLWRCGVCDSVSVGERTFDALRLAAEDAVKMARDDRRSEVRRWRREEANVAPDVIIVEDDAALSEMLQYVLRSGGLTYRAFATGDAALEALETFRTDDRRPLVLLDIDLPGLDGHALHDRLSISRPEAYAVVFITGHAQEGDQIRALRAGALDYLPKPVSFRSLLSKIPVWRERASRQHAESLAS